mgnify:CR=1 FL=1
MKVANRIKANEDFVSTVRKGRALKSLSYIVHFRQNELDICRIGISVSKKIGIAVTRNRVKRQIRAMCDSLVNYSLHAFDVVVVVKADYLSKSYQENLEILQKLFKEIGITE